MGDSTDKLKSTRNTRRENMIFSSRTRSSTCNTLTPRSKPKNSEMLKKTELLMMVLLCSQLITGRVIQISSHSINSTVSTRRLSDKKTSSNSSKLLSAIKPSKSSMTDLTVSTEDTGLV